MAYNKALTERVRRALLHTKAVEEKIMFRGVTFMVNGKMLMTAGDDEVMFRVSPDDHDWILEKFDGRAMTTNGRLYRGYVYVKAAKLNAAGMRRLVALALAFNATRS